MKVRITPKVDPRHYVNVREGMTGAKNEHIVTTLAPGAIVEATKTRNKAWYKVEGGYVRSDLVEPITEASAPEVDDADDEDYDPPEVEE